MHAVAVSDAFAPEVLVAPLEAPGVGPPRLVSVVVASPAGGCSARQTATARPEPEVQLCHCWAQSGSPLVDLPRADCSAVAALPPDDYWVERGEPRDDYSVEPKMDDRSAAAVPPDGLQAPAGFPVVDLPRVDCSVVAVSPRDDYSVEPKMDDQSAVAVPPDGLRAQAGSPAVDLPRVCCSVATARPPDDCLVEREVALDDYSAEPTADDRSAVMVPLDDSRELAGWLALAAYAPEHSGLAAGR